MLTFSPFLLHIYNVSSHFIIISVGLPEGRRDKPAWTREGQVIPDGTLGICFCWRQAQPDFSLPSKRAAPTASRPHPPQPHVHFWTRVGLAVGWGGIEEQLRTWGPRCYQWEFWANGADMCQQLGALRDTALLIWTLIATPQDKVHPQLITKET